jgi:hypothetical protein
VLISVSDKLHLSLLQRARDLIDVLTPFWFLVFVEWLYQSVVLFAPSVALWEVERRQERGMGVEKAREENEEMKVWINLYLLLPL